jgi:hypothetical protein
MRIALSDQAVKRIASIVKRCEVGDQYFYMRNG